MANLTTGFKSITILLFWCGAAFAQNVAQKGTEKFSDREKQVFYVNMLHKIAEEKAFTDSAMSFRCVKEALSISEKITYDYGKAVSFYLMGILHDCHNTSVQKSLTYYKKSAALAHGIDSATLEAKNYLNIGRVFQRLELYEYSEEYFLRSLEIFKKRNDLVKHAVTQIHLASHYAERNGDGYDKALVYFDSALKTATRLKNIFIHTYAVSVFSPELVKNQDALSAQHYLERAIAQAEKSPSLRKLLSRLYCNMGEALLETGELPASMEYLKKAEAAYEHENDAHGKMNVYLTHARHHRRSQKPLAAADYYHKALKEAQNLQLKQTIANIYDTLSHLAMENHLYKKAWDYRSLQLAYVDSFQKEQKSHLLAEAAWKLNANAPREASATRNNQRMDSVFIKLLLVAVTILFFLTFLYLMLRLRRVEKEKLGLLKEKSTLTSKNIVLEKELISKRSEHAKLQEQLESYAKTETANSLNLIQKNEILKNIKAKAEEVKKASSVELPSKINNLIHTVNFALNIDKDWEHFKLHFEQVHNNFFDNLKAKYPSLNSNDLKLCALLKLNLDTKEIATVMDISPESVKVARSRLRKKLQLDSSENLSSFITQI